MTVVVQYGLVANHQYYSMDISGFQEEHKRFLQNKLQTLHEYSWLIGLSGNFDPMGDHYLSVRGMSRDIDAVVGELIIGTRDDDIPASAPSFRMVDPDQESEWRKVTLRERFYMKYDQTN